METNEIIQAIRDKLMFGGISTEQLRQIMDICEEEIINRMAAATVYDYD